MHRKTSNLENIFWQKRIFFVNFLLTNMILTLFTLPSFCQDTHELIEVGYQYYAKRNIQHAVKIWEEGLVQAEKSHKKRLIATFKYLLGIAHKDLLDYSKALKYLEQSKTIFLQINDIERFAYCNSGVGTVYFDMGDYNKAMDYFKLALMTWRSSADANPEGEAVDLINLAGALASLGQYSEALKYSYQALDLNRQTRNIPAEAICLSNIGNIYINIGKYNKALENLNKSLKIHEKIRDINGKGNDYSRIAICYTNLKDFQTSLKRIFQVKKKHFKCLSLCF